MVANHKLFIGSSLSDEPLQKMSIHAAEFEGNVVEYDKIDKSF